MDDKPSAAVEEWFKREYPLWRDGMDTSFKHALRRAYLAATERTARRCVEICRECDEKNWDAEDCGVVIAKEFGLD